MPQRHSASNPSVRSAILASQSFQGYPEGWTTDDRLSLPGLVRSRRALPPPPAITRGWGAVHAQAILGLGEAAQHVVQDAAVAVVLDFDRRIDSAGRHEVDHRTVSLASSDFYRLLWLQVV